MGKSMEWVYHDRGYNEPALARKWQKELWDKMFKGATFWKIIRELNARWLPDNRKLIYANPKDPAALIVSVQDIFEDLNPQYEINLLCKGDPKQDTFIFEASELSIPGRWQQAPWEEMFQGFQFSGIIYELNNRWFPDRKEVVVINPKDPVVTLDIVRALVHDISPRYDARLFMRVSTEAPPTALGAIEAA